MPSVAERVADAVAALVSPVEAIPVVTRKVPDLLDGDTPPLVVVSVLEDEVEPLTFEDEDAVGYRVWVVRYEPSAGKAKDDAAGRAWKQEARRRVRVPALPAVPEVIGAEPMRTEPFPRGGKNANVNATAVGVIYRTDEPGG